MKKISIKLMSLFTASALALSVAAVPFAAESEIETENEAIQVEEKEYAPPKVVLSFDEYFPEEEPEPEAAEEEQVEEIQPAAIPDEGIGGTCGDNVSGFLATDGTLTISGSGKMDDGYSPWYLYTDQIKSVIIENGVTSIGGHAFFGYSSLTSVDIPDSVQSIGHNAFQNCYSLTSVTIGNSVQSIGEGAFCDCYSLASVNIPDSVQTIGSYAFADCSSLTSVDIPNSVQSIGNFAFEGCSTLTSVDIPNSVQSIGEGAFYGCSSIISLTIPNSVKSIGSDAFTNTQALIEFEGNAPSCSGNSSGGSVILYDPETNGWPEDSYTWYGIAAFPKGEGLAFSGKCGENAEYQVEIDNRLLRISGSGTMTNHPWNTVAPLIRTVTIEEGITSIVSEAFYGYRQIEEVTVPSTVTSIGSSVFASCINLKDITVAEGNSSYTDEDGILYSSDKSLLLLYPIGKDSISFEIPKEVKTIDSSAFAYNPHIKSITFEGNSQLTSIDSFAFTYCTALETVSFGINSQLNYIYEYAFSNCTALESVSFGINSQLKTISDYAFSYCSSLKSIPLDNCTLLQSINYNAFYYCTSLTTLTMPESLTYISKLAFGDCSNLKSVYFLGNAPTNFGYYVFSNCPVTLYYMEDKYGWSFPLWKGYPTMMFTLNTDMDLTNDGKTDILDVIFLRSKLLQESYTYAEEHAYDLNGDGQINKFDVRYIIYFILNGKVMLGH